MTPRRTKPLQVEKTGPCTVCGQDQTRSTYCNIDTRGGGISIRMEIETVCGCGTTREDLDAE